MRYQELMELTGVKKFANMSHEDIMTYIENNLGDSSVQVLGVGSHGAALLIGQHVYKFWMRDSAYDDFVKYALQNQDNPFLPKFLSRIKQMPAFFLRHADAPDYVNYIKMEVLDPMFTITNIEFNLPIDTRKNHNSIFEYDLDSISFGEVITICFSVMRTGKTTDHKQQLLTFSKRLSTRRDYPYEIKELGDELPYLVNAICDLLSMTKHQLDLHVGNMMTRPDGQLVILDPICNTDDLKANIEFLEFTKKKPEDRIAVGKSGLNRSKIRTT